jgi:hypothetical protein
MVYLLLDTEQFQGNLIEIRNQPPQTIRFNDQSLTTSDPIGQEGRIDPPNQARIFIDKLKNLKKTISTN